METNHAERLVRKALAETEVIEAFGVLIGEMIRASSTPVPPSDFFTESAALMKREARVKTLEYIMGQFRTLHEDAKSDNPYNLNT